MIDIHSYIIPGKGLCVKNKCKNGQVLIWMSNAKRVFNKDRRRKDVISYGNYRV